MSKKRKYVLIAVIAVIAVILLGTSWSVIPTGYTGVRTTFGQISSEPVQSGFNWKIPIVQSIKKVNNKQQDILFDSQIWSETSERTAIYFEGVNVTYSINGEKSAWIFANVSDYKNNLINEGIVASAIKTASKQLNSTDATNRGLIEPLTLQTLQQSVDDKYGESVIRIHKVVINNVDFEETYNNAIAEKQNAQLAYEKQQIENQKVVEKAEADAEAKRVEAAANADAMLIEAKAEAEANQRLAESITNEILMNKYYDVWDGVLPRVNASDSNIMYGITDETLSD